MPPQSNYGSSQSPSFPALYLYPLNDSFVPKQISLVGGQRVKIGRQTNQKTAPAERNGYFDSKVLSRQHAEVWEDSGRIFIKDVKSSNGTFINGDRLSPEGVESEPFDLKTDDIVEFGIDIVGEDNKTIIHHKVAARVACVFNSEDAANAPKESHSYQQHPQQPSHAAQTSAAGTLGAGARRPSIQPQTSMSTGMGGLGAGRQPGRGGISFDHILNRLQSELNKARDTNTDINIMATHINDVAEMMAGGAFVPSFPSQMPAVKPPPANPPPKDTNEPSVVDLQNQVIETTAKMDGIMEKLQNLEHQINTAGVQELVAQVSTLSELLEERRNAEQQQQQHVHDRDDDDTSSIHTITPHELESVPEEDETEVEESEEERSARREELGRPHTPEPSSLGMHDDYDSKDDNEQMLDHPTHPPGLPDELTQRITLLTDKLESCMELSLTLQTRHAGTVQQIDDLNAKVKDLEELIHSTEATRSEQADQYAKSAEISALLALAREEQEGRQRHMLEEFQRMLDDQVAKQKEEQLAIFNQLESNFVAQTKQLAEATQMSIQSLESRFNSLSFQFNTERVKQAGLVGMHGVGKSSRRKHGLITPPSPSLSSHSDSELYNTDLNKFHDLTAEHHGRERRRTQSASPSRRSRRKTSRSRSPATSTTSTTLVDSATGSVADGASTGAKPEISFDAQAHSRSSSSDECTCRKPDSSHSSDSPEKTKFHPRLPPTPSASLHLEDIAGGRRATAKARAAEHQLPVRNFIREATRLSDVLFMLLIQAVSNTQVAVGVFVLGVAAAAVLWRVKE